jgi:hypothetical protein
MQHKFIAGDVFLSNFFPTIAFLLFLGYWILVIEDKEELAPYNSLITHPLPYLLRREMSYANDFLKKGVL